MADHTDERIRALIARAVAQAPPPPPAQEVATPLPDLAHRTNGSRPSHGSTELGWGEHGHRDRDRGRRVVLVAAAGIAAVALAVVGILSTADRSRDVGTGDPGEAALTQGNAIRYVPAATPAGLHLARIDDSVAVSGDHPPDPRVSVLEGPGGLRVRIVVDPPDAAATSTPPTTIPPTSADTTGPTATTGPTVTGPTGTTGPSLPAGTDGSTSTTTTTTVGGPPGFPARAGLESAVVRGTTGALEQHSATATTLWFLQGGVPIAVDVFGADATVARRIVDGLTPRGDGGFDPAPAEGLTLVVDLPPGPADDRQPATTTMAYATDDPGGGVAFAVTTEQLAVGRDDLLTATAGSFGELQQWRQREVLVQDRAAYGTPGTAASFVDPAGVLVTVWTPTGGGLRAYVDGLEGVRGGSWRELVDQASARVADLPAGTPIELGPATVTSHGGARGLCVEVDEERACRPVDATDDLTPDGAARGAAASLLVAGEWWYVGYSTDAGGLGPVTPDAGTPAAHETVVGGVLWFAVELPDQASTATIQFDAVDGRATAVSQARPAS